MAQIKNHSYHESTGKIVEGQRMIEVGDLQIPDLWHIAMEQTDPAKKAAILNTWHAAHDLKKLVTGRSN